MQSLFTSLAEIGRVTDFYCEVDLFLCSQLLQF
jgi:hypothetical protein